MLQDDEDINSQEEDSNESWLESKANSYSKSMIDQICKTEEEKQSFYLKEEFIKTLK